MAATDIVRVVNKGTEDHVGTFDGKPYRIPAGGEALLDKEAAIKDFGNWDARNLGSEPRLRKREHEVQRLRGLRGVVAGSKIPVMVGGKGKYKDDGYPEEVLADQVWRERMPNVEIYLMDGTKVTTVLEDPEGTTLPLEDAPQEDLARTINAMKAEMEKMQRAFESTLEKQAQVEVPVDLPENAPRPKPKKAEVVAAQQTRE